MEKIKIDYTSLRNSWVHLFVAITMVLLYHGVAYLHPANNNWLENDAFSLLTVVRFIFIDQICLEFITYSIIGHCLFLFASQANLTTVPLSLRAVLAFKAKFLPVLFIAFFAFNPITQTLRYWLHHYPVWKKAIYLQHYFYSWHLYLIYLIPVIIGGYLLITIALYLSYKDFKKQPTRLTTVTQTIEASNAEGKSILEVPAILYFEYLNRNCYAITEKQCLKVSYTLQELEQLLSEASFFRINRASLINLNHLKNYAYWENDKYIVRSTNNTEFIASRNRIKNLKKILAPEVTLSK